MTKSPITVLAGSKAKNAIDALAARNLSELPVIDGAGKVVGLIDITDVVGW